MAQAGIHALVGTMVKKATAGKEWLLVGILFGSLFPDADNLAVAVATVAKLPYTSEQLHRTFTHSLFIAAALTLVIWLIGRAARSPGWSNFGIGLGVGIVMHILLDLLLWFDGVYLFWPLPVDVNLWANVSPPGWFMTLMMPLEFLFIALYFLYLGSAARKHRTDGDFLKALTVWTVVQFVLLAVFTPLFYLVSSGMVFTLYGALYLVSLIAALGITVRMRRTVTALA